jgi:tetratricopeptide (TPR) repeat protein
MAKKTLSDDEKDALLQELLQSMKSKPIRHKPPKLVRVEEDVWQFDWGDPIVEAEESVNMGCVYLDRGKPKAALVCFRSALEADPNHLDAMHHLAIALGATGKVKEAYEMWERALETARKAIPPRAFKRGEHTIPWVFLNNRPFLRLLEAHATNLLVKGDIDGSIEVYKEIQSYNPDDNQGVRESLAQLYMHKGRLEDMVALGEKYKDDVLSSTVYAHPLALFKLGRRKEAEKLLKRAIKRRPNVADELLKKEHEKPETDMPGYISFDGWDMAYDYWDKFGDYWDEEALDWLRVVRGAKGGGGKKKGK